MSFEEQAGVVAALDSPDPYVRGRALRALEAQGWTPSSLAQALSLRYARRDRSPLVGAPQDLLAELARRLLEAPEWDQPLVAEDLCGLPGPAGIEPLLAWLFRPGLLLFSEAALATWVRRIAPRFGGASEVILLAASYLGHHERGGSSSRSVYQNDSQRSDEAVAVLAGRRHPATSNLLHLVLRKQPVELDLEVSDLGVRTEVLRFEAQKRVARDALRARKNPGYDPGGYLVSDAFLG